MNKEELIELIKKHGTARDNVEPGDRVLVDGANNGGEYVTLCRVVAVENEKVQLQEEHTYYLNGGEFPERKISSVSMDYFKKSIPEHIQEGRDFFKELLGAFEENEGEQDSGGNG